VMEEKEQTDRGRGSGICIVLIAMTPVFYVLLLGPAVRWHGSCPRHMKKAIEVVFTPLVWLHENTPLKEPLGAYVELWEP
jgi:hypothetical protein